MIDSMSDERSTAASGRLVIELSEAFKAAVPQRDCEQVERLPGNLAGPRVLASARQLIG
jgi:hypothetical protein